MLATLSNSLRNVTVRMAKQTDGEFVKTQIRKLTQLAEGFKELPIIEGIDKCWNDIINDKERSPVFVAEDKGSPVGAAVCSINYALHKGGKYCYLEELIVDDSKRTTGAGSALLKAVESYAKNQGMISVDLTQPPPGSNYDKERSQFYAKRGFGTTGMSRTKQFVQTWK